MVAIIVGAAVAQWCPITAKVGGRHAGEWASNGEVPMAGKRRRIDRWGFPMWILSLLLVAIGVTQGITLVWALGLILLGGIVLTIIVRAVRDVWFPPARTKRQRSGHDDRP